MKRTILGMAEAGEPLLQRALQAIRAHLKAVDEERSAEEIERLRLEADHLYQTVIDYQLHKAGTLGQVSPLIDGCDLQTRRLHSVECRLDLVSVLGDVVPRGCT